MCPNCFRSGFDGFCSYWEFEAFETALQQKLMRQQLIPVAGESAIDLLAMAPEQLYRCSTCGETWAISSPDNAWRGFFLPMADAIAYRRKLNTGVRIKRLFGIAIAVATAALMLWQAFE